MAKHTSPGEPLFDDPTAHTFTDGSVLPSGPRGWGIEITFPASGDTRSIWGPVIASSSGPHRLGAMRATSNTGALSAIYHSLDWIGKR